MTEMIGPQFEPTDEEYKRIEQMVDSNPRMDYDTAMRQVIKSQRTDLVNAALKHYMDSSRAEADRAQAALNHNYVEAIHEDEYRRRRAELENQYLQRLGITPEEARTKAETQIGAKKIIEDERRHSHVAPPRRKV